jgi:hypothetical protein
MPKSNVTPALRAGACVARLTITRTDGKKTIVEVHKDATFNAFYHVYIQVGRRWSTKRLVRMASRNEGLMAINAHLQTPGLEAFAKRIAVFQSTTNPVVSEKIQISKKRAYRRLLAAAPESLGMVKTRVNIPVERWRSARAIPVQLSVAERVAQ